MHGTKMDTVISTMRPQVVILHCVLLISTAEVVDPSVDEDNQSLKICHTTGIYTGTGTARNITGLGFKPDIVMDWSEVNKTTAKNYWFDSTRGVGKYMFS